MDKEEKTLLGLRQDIIDNNLHVKAIIQVSWLQSGWTDGRTEEQELVKRHDEHLNVLVGAQNS